MSIIPSFFITKSRTIAKREEITGLIVQNSSIEKLLEKLNTIAQVVLKTISSSKAKLANAKEKENNNKEVKEQEKIQKEGKKEVSSARMSFLM